MRILGLDYGEKRTGVAVCDELGLRAQGLPTGKKEKMVDKPAACLILQGYLDSIANLLLW